SGSATVPGSPRRRARRVLEYRMAKLGVEARRALRGPMARQIVLTVTAVLAATASLAAPPPKKERQIEATARKVTRSGMIGHDGRKEAFVFSTDLTPCTTQPPMLGTCAPPFANILTDPQTNFLPCRGGPFALCYYSGPEGTLPCTVRHAKEGTFAECKCIEVP